MTPEEHLREALKHAEKAEEAFEDDSKEESVANNAVRWTRKAVRAVSRRD